MCISIFEQSRKQNDVVNRETKIKDIMTLTASTVPQHLTLFERNVFVLFLTTIKFFPFFE